MHIDLTGRVAIVTGGTRGIGFGIAESLMASGAEVVVCGRNAPAHRPAHEGRKAQFDTVDVREPDDVERLMDDVMKRYGRLDIVVNNAGGSPPADAATVSPRFSAAILRLNLTAPLIVAQAANRVMQAQDDGGVILNIASISGVRASPGTAAYGASKAGLINLTKSLAIEWAPKVRVNAISPGLVATEQSLEHYGDEASMAKVAATVPLGRFGTPADIGAACVFLGSPLAGYISGANLVIDGGGETPAFLTAALEAAKG